MAEYLEFKKSNCKNCYKCIRHCPVKSIRFSGDLASVIPDECILCGQCYVVCPQNAKQIVDETEIAGVLLKGDRPVYASIAPSFSAYFEGIDIETLELAMKKLGFAGAEETALGATLVKKEYEELVRKGDRDIIITSCCHTVNLLVEKYYPELTGCLAPVMTPMRAHAADIKRRHPEAAIIFAGPCLSKKDEAALDGLDAALTFDELSDMFEKAGISLADEKKSQSAAGKKKKISDADREGRARRFPVSGGILDSMIYKNPSYTYSVIDGMNSCKNALDDIRSGNLHHFFIEMSACKGSCIGGPILEKKKNQPLRNYQSVMSYAGEKDFKVPAKEDLSVAAEYTGLMLSPAQPTEKQILDILRKMGKYKPSDELNCGTCGYSTCRDKAIAVYQGKAEISMCLPFLMEKSERFTNSILDNTPNGILVVNEFFEIQQINKAALRMLNVKDRTDVLGEPLIRIMNPKDFMAVLRNNGTVINKRDYYADFGKYLELTIVQDKVANNLIGIFRDFTEEETERVSREEMSRQTIDTADKVVDKQMRIVQEIASLLGETAAETKIALTRLKESITDEDHE